MSVSTAVWQQQGATDTEEYRRQFPLRKIPGGGLLTASHEDPVELSSFPIVSSIGMRPNVGEPEIIAPIQRADESSASNVTH
jgi:hypothetical protein